ncbi:MAG TPA: Asp23/Gls24 family envelope stress response protein [Acidimicrobiales bacterium]|nr:Asp23/Gls24 family envelope stress response protein [Acidimicrobiales bacterium]
MTEASAKDSAGARSGAPRSRNGAGQAGAQLKTERGTTSISDSVVAKVVGLATREIPGVQAMGKTVARTMGALKSALPVVDADTTSQGVSVEVGERQAAIDLDIVAYYGQSIVDVAEAVRRNVADRVEGMTGLEVIEVNVTVDDIYIEGSEDQSSRVG